MATARFRIGTATTNSASTTWSWRAYDTPTDISSGSYVKVDLESTNGVRTLSVSIPSADEQTLSEGVPTVTTVQSSKTATFLAGTAAARTYLVRAVINNGLDLNNDSVSDYTKTLAVHIKTAESKRLIAVGETDDADRTYGYTPKLNAVIRTPSVLVIATGGTAVTGSIYSSGGALLFLGASGTVTVIAPA